MGDFTGFSFGDYYCGEGEPPTNGHKKIGIIRVSSGDRYDENLHPEIKDKTAEVPGLNGEYYFGSDFGTKSIDIDIAFDSLTEKEFITLRRAFGTKDIKKLIFDERPYKYYMAKLESPIELSYICFDEPKKQVVGTAVGDERYGVRIVNRTTTIDPETEEEVTTIERERIYPYEKLDGTERIYKGEGKISLICHFPFAKSVFKELTTAQQESDWAVSSGILSSAEYVPYDTYTIPQEDMPYIKVYNAGDVPTGFRMYVPFEGWSNKALTLKYQANSYSDYDILVINKPTPKRNGGTDQNPIYDDGILIDTNNGLIIGVSDYTDNIVTTSGNLYNECVESGYFFKLQPNLKTDEAKIVITNGNTGIRIFYDYLYF